MVCQNCGKNEANVKYTQSIFQISLMICLMMNNYYQVL